MAQKKSGETTMTRILVLESELRLRHSLKTILESAGYEVDVADDGVDALSRHARRPADLLIADGHVSPAGFSGTRVLAVPGGGACEAVKGTDITHFLPKPFGREDLLAAVRVSLGAAPPIPTTR
ncbi:hypothetical protein A6A05_11545 [Magnetospirillum moscoviense]|uniref:Response regulatory domain-containing protein n=2 Tax=Magnetospirillum moscoviense TaxID=1437059 RepID=A0A178MS38_9PROT|nr:hypothetical protein A6A05_11545 [Magnetospirillum moscoviense]